MPEGEVRFNRAWNPSKSEKPRNELEAASPFRKGFCRFAFEVLPRLLNARFNGWIAELQETGEVQELYAAWADHRSAAQHEPEADSPRAELVDFRDIGGLLITMPEPLCAPEPYFLFVPLSDATDANGQGSPRRIYLLEMAQGTAGNAALLCRIDDNSHGIMGEVRGSTRDDFLEAVRGMLSGDASLDCSIALFSQLRFYAEISEREK